MHLLFVSLSLILSFALPLSLSLSLALPLSLSLVSAPSLSLVCLCKSKLSPLFYTFMIFFQLSLSLVFIVEFQQLFAYQKNSKKSSKENWVICFCIPLQKIQSISPIKTKKLCPHPPPILHYALSKNGPNSCIFFSFLSLSFSLSRSPSLSLSR